MKQNGSLLVVDDDDKVRQLFAKCLRRAGYQVAEAATGREGLQVVRQIRPDLVLLDVRLPDVGGLEVCHQIKSAVDLRDVLVILCSGDAITTADTVHGLGTGADEYLTKPVDPAELLARIRTLMRLRNTVSALRASEEHHRRLLDILPDAVCLVQPDGRIRSVNSRAVTMLAYDSAQDLGRKTLFDLIPANEHARVKADFVRALQLGTLRATEFTMLQKNGSALSVEMSATVSNLGNGNPAGLVCVLRDTTARKKAEDRLRASEQRFRQLADNLRQVFWMTDAVNHKLIYVSPAYEEIWGRTCKSLYDSNLDWLEAIHPKDRQRVAAAMSQNQMEGAFDEVYRILRPDGSLRWIQDRAIPVRNEAGQVYRIAGLAEDITKRKEDWDALCESEAHKSAIMRVALDAIITIDHAGGIIDINPTGEKMFAKKRANLVGQNISQVIPAALRPWFLEGLAGCFTGKEGPAAGSRIELPVLRTDGGRFFAELAITRIERKGRPTFTLYIRDITQRKRAEEELLAFHRRIIEVQEAERLRIAGELHDGINQIIASVKMRLRKVGDHLPQLKPAARVILSRCDQLLVKALEENRRIARNLRPSDLDDFGLFAACQNYCDAMKLRSNLRIECHVDSYSQRLPSDTELNLFRIVQEAISNIEKHAQARTVQVQLGFQGDAIMLKISDNGRGFDPEKTGAPRKKNRGFGLRNMRERAASLGGTFEIQSAPKKGATITVTVPVPAGARRPVLQT